MVIFNRKKYIFSNTCALVFDNSASKCEILRLFIRRDPKKGSENREFEKPKLEKSVVK